MFHAAVCWSNMANSLLHPISIATITHPAFLVIKSDLHRLLHQMAMMVMGKHIFQNAMEVVIAGLEHQKLGTLLLEHKQQFQTRKSFQECACSSRRDNLKVKFAVQAQF